MDIVSTHSCQASMLILGNMGCTILVLAVQSGSHVEDRQVLDVLPTGVMTE